MRIKELLFQNHGLRQTIIKNIFWLGLSQLGSRLFRIIIIIYAARILGAAEYGIFAYILSFAGFFAIFANLGITPLLTKNTATHPKQRNEYFATSFWLIAFLLLAVTLIIVFIAPHIIHIEKAKMLIPFIALLVIFDGLRNLAIAFLRGLEKMEKEALILIAMNATIMVTGFIVLSILPSSESLIFSYVASVGASVILSIIILRNQFVKIFHFFKKKLACQIIKDAWPIAFSGVLGSFMLNTDIIMLGWWRTVEEIGYYSISQRIVGALYAMPAFLAAGIFPALSRLVKQNNRQKAKILSEKLITITFLVVIPLAIGGVILGQPIINLIFGAEYLPATPAFQILIIGIIIMFSGPLIFNIILAHNQQRRIIKYVAIGSLINIILNILLIPIYGIIGAAVTTIIAYTIYYSLIWKLIKKLTGIQVLFYLKKIIAATIIMGIFTFTLNQFDLNVMINIIASAGLYFGILFLFKEKIIKEAISLFKENIKA